MKKFIFLIIILVLFVACNNKENYPNLEITNYTVVDHPYERIVLEGDHSNKGYADPSVEYLNDDIGYLTYSGLEQKPENLKYQNLEFIHTHLAKTTDHGKTWIFIKRLTESLSDTVESPIFAKKLGLETNLISGEWHHEVPSLVYDPDDIGKEWKLFWHKYFSMDAEGGNPRERILTHSWIMMKEADIPENLDSAEEIKLFSPGLSPGGLYNFDDPNTQFSWYTEPGAIYWQGKIYVALSTYIEGNVPVTLVTSSDHGKTWEYIGILIDGNDAFNDYFQFSGASLVEENGKIFLFAAPVIKKKGTFSGTLVFEFEDIDKGLLKRDNSGNTIPHKYFKRSLSGSLHAGTADYHKYNTYGGSVMMQADGNYAPAYAQLWNTKETIIE
jgi:hypothetical protein